MTAHQRILWMVLAVGLVIIGGSIYEYWGKAEGETTETVAAVETKEAEPELTVYVCGAVNQPGVVQVAAHSRVIDAVKLCGGTLATADITKVNMAKPLSDGEQILVPEKAGIRENAQAETKAVQESTKAGKDGTDEKININTAGKEELDRLPGVGPSMAEAIIAYRDKEGAFSTIEELKKVRGIGEAKFNKMKDRLTL